MPTVLHLFKGSAPPLARTTIERQIAAGDAVAVVLLEGAPPPTGLHVAVHRVPEDVGYDHLLELVFGADQVITW